MKNCILCGSPMTNSFEFSSYLFCSKAVTKPNIFNVTEFYKEIIYGNYFSFKKWYSHLVVKKDDTIAYCIIDDYIFGDNHQNFSMSKNEIISFDELKNALSENIDFQKYLDYSIL